MTLSAKDYGSMAGDPVRQKAGKKAAWTRRVNENVRLDLIRLFHKRSDEPFNPESLHRFALALIEDDPESVMAQSLVGLRDSGSKYWPGRGFE